MGTDYSLCFLLSKRHDRRQRPIESAVVRLCEAESNEERAAVFSGLAVLLLVIASEAVLMMSVAVWAAVNSSPLMNSETYSRC